MEQDQVSVPFWTDLLHYVGTEWEAWEAGQVAPEVAEVFIDLVYGLLGHPLRSNEDRERTVVETASKILNDYCEFDECKFGIVEPDINPDFLY